MQVASSFSHTVVLAPDGDVDALFLLGNDKKSEMESSAHKNHVKLDVRFGIRSRFD